MDKRHHMLDEWIKILKGKWNGDYTHLAIYDYGKAAHWRYDECPCLPEQCFSKGEFEARLAEIEKENDMNESTLVPREEMSDLDWLARNVHEWPFNMFDSKPTEKYVWHQPYCGGDILAAFRDRPSVFTKDQWLARRAELQNKPSFSDHHDAKCFVQNDSGTWFKNRNSTNVIPESDGGWFDRDMSCGWTQLGAGEVLGDWRDTLAKRPADMSEQSVTARLKEATDNVLAAAPELMADKYKFEPFVSVEDAATAKQPAPKGSGNPILGMILADLTNRALEGKEKYGEPLLAHNGRNPLWDAYQEALDLAMYLRQAIEEQKQC